MIDDKRRSDADRSSRSSGANYDKHAVEILDNDTQHVLMKTFEAFYEQESDSMIATLEESREELKNSMLDLCIEQDRYKEELVRVSGGKYEFKRKKENLIPLSDYLRKKKGLAMRYTSNTHAEIANGVQPQSDREAVERYLRKRERQKNAEENRVNRQINEESLESETKKILGKLNEIDMTKQREKDRQMEKIQAKLKGGNKPNQKNDEQIANEIIESYQDSKMAYERDKLAQQQKIQARLSAARERRALTPTGRDLSDGHIAGSSEIRPAKYLTPNEGRIASIDI